MEDSPTKPPFGVTSAEVVIIDIYIYRGYNPFTKYQQDIPVDPSRRGSDGSLHGDYKIDVPAYSGINQKHFDMM